MKLIIFLIIVVNGFCTQAQNLGIGTTLPTRGKLEIVGAAAPGTTIALFGSTGNGVSLQHNWPGIGFNQYRDDASPLSQVKYIGNGFAALQYFDYNTGTYAFDLFPSGTASSFTPVGTRAITIANNGNTSIRTNANAASLNVGRGDGTDGSAVFAGPAYSSYFN